MLCILFNKFEIIYTDTTSIIWFVYFYQELNLDLYGFVLIDSFFSKDFFDSKIGLKIC